MAKTTMQISEDTLKRLKFVKNYLKQSYDEAINLLIDEYEDLGNDDIKDMQEALEGVEQGKIITFDQVLKEAALGLS